MIMRRVWICVLLVLCMCAGCGSVENQPFEDNVPVSEPSEETTAAPALNRSEALSPQQLTESLSGLTQEELHDLWGAPGMELFGMYGDVWLTGSDTRVAVYYDGDGVVSEVRKNPLHDWGITLTAENVTPTGLTIICTQSGGDSAGELQTGSYYIVQKLVEGQWEPVEYTEIDEEQVGWTSEAWLIPMDSSVEWEVDWQWLYGELPAGQYRIGKKIMDFVETGNYEKAMFFAEFTIE